MFWNRYEGPANTLSVGKVRNIIIKLQLPQIVLELFDGKCNDEKAGRLLGSQYQRPLRLFEQPGEAYKVDRYIPFLAVWQSVIFAYDTISQGFVRYSLERFCEAELVFLTWSGLMLKEIIGWWELEWPDEDIIFAGNLFGINDTEKLIREIALHNVAGLPYNARAKWENDLLNKIGGLAR
ncbi:MAG: hypothetical protein ACOYJB_06660 [Christensenellaceae bacterium]